MTFELPDLDTTTSAQLQAELIRRIPQFTTLWTDFNDSDPGITLLQLLCWIAESLTYQANAIPIETQRNFLRWVLGLAFSTTTTPYAQAAETQFDLDFLALKALLAEVEQGAALSADDLQRGVLTYLGKPFQALTLDDAVRLALQTNQIIDLQQQAHPAPPPGPAKVLRADALVAGEAVTVAILSDIPWRYHYPSFANSGIPDADGLLRAVLVRQAPSDGSADAAREAKLLEMVAATLAPHVLLGNRISVMPSALTDINIRAVVRCPAHLQQEVILAALIERLFAYFLPCTGGDSGIGWGYGVPPHLDNVAHPIGAVPGVQAIELLEMTFIPTVLLPGMAQLGANALLADLPPGPPAMIYRGLPRLRCLDLSVGTAAS